MFVCLGATSAHGAEPEHTIKIGNFRKPGDMAVVTVAFTNASSADVRSAEVSCGFVDDDGFPIGQGSAFFENVAAGDTAYGDAGAFAAAAATKADCRVVSVR